ncbi:MerR family transcriptional regulator [Streptomyces marincola]|uniref:MerR family transcriptional regulator n=1 Tax=Streptomyces marincola TaxID=2878388 RepID=UPI001CF2DF5E|nr:MerR family transcriptional regulator [Streptomyces marincola]UCM89245.1 MerR family transcriptional regulator [Streptomyces marincola]
MRIGELAALAGVTPRTVRHYHHIGLLPESAREANGYRSYGLRDAVRLGRVRRLTELGLSLDEIRDILTDDTGRELHEVLAELDAELAARQEALGRRRARLAELLREVGTAGDLPAEAPVSPEVAALFASMARTAADLPGPEPHTAVRERELLALLDGSADPATADWLAGLLRTADREPDAMRRVYEVYARMDELADADASDPRIPRVAEAIVAVLPEEFADALAGPSRQALDAAGAGGGGFAEAFFAELPPAQAAAVRQAVLLLAQRDGGR